MTARALTAAATGPAGCTGTGAGTATTGNGPGTSSSCSGTDVGGFAQVQVAHVQDKEHPPSSSSSSRLTTTSTGGFQGLKTQTPQAASHSRGPSPYLHSHRQNHNASKLPSFRLTDIKPAPPSAGTSAPTSPAPLQSPPPLSTTAAQHRQQLSRAPSFSFPTLPLSDQSPGRSTSLDAAVVGLADRDSHATASIFPTLSRIKAKPPAPPPLPPPAPSRRLESKPSIEQLEPATPQRPLRTRASSYQTKIDTPIAEQSPRVVLRRPASVPESLAEEAQTSTHPTSLSRVPSIKKTHHRRPPASFSANGVATSAGPPPSLSTQRRQVEGVYHSNNNAPAEVKSPRERDQGQTDFASFVPLSPSSPPDESRDQKGIFSPTPNKSPVSNDNNNKSNHYKQTAAEAESPSTARRRVPPPTPKRSSRLVNHRSRSVVIDMDLTSRTYNFTGNSADTSQVPVFRGVDARQQESDIPSAAQVSSQRPSALNSNDDTGDVFLKIASEENTRRSTGENIQSNLTGSSQIRTSNSTSRRPQSTYFTSYRITSPPRQGRRLSDHQEHDEEVTSEVARGLAYRRLVGKAGSVYPGEQESPARTSSSALRPSPIASRPLNMGDRTPGDSNHQRRRPSITENGLASPLLIQAQSKTENSSPFIRAIGGQVQGTPDILPTIEGTESTGSTTGPSTVWDELDDLKSRIHRLELTGKLPPTSGAAVIKGAEDRPTTATTTVTTVSISPKKSVTGLQAEAGSNTSSQKEAHPHHPNLHSALAKTKSFLSPEIYRALETAANDALALSSMMGAPGQPGPISSAAGAAGSGVLLTDRQLRRRADGVCRSLTELCIALNENPARAMPLIQAQTNTTGQGEAIIVPAVTKSYTGMASRRASVVPEQIAQTALSPRAMTKYEERRNIILNNGVMASPRGQAPTPAIASDASLARRSSLVVTRNRRAAPEELEDGRRSTMLLRNRRAGTEDVEEGRRTSLLVRGRRGTLEETDESRFRTPSRATTEVNGTRALARDYVADARAARWDESAQPHTAVGRRFLASNLHASRTIVPASSAATPVRKYIERSYTLPETEGAVTAEKAADRMSRHIQFSQSTFQKRTSNLGSRRMVNAESVIASPSSAGGTTYR